MMNLDERESLGLERGCEPAPIALTLGRDRYGDGAINAIEILAIRVGTAGRRYPKRFGVGCVLRGRSARQEHGGPMVAGPWAYTFPLCAVIDNHGGSAAERAAGLAAGTEIDVSTGARVTLDGTEYRVELYGPKHDPYIRLVRA